MRRRQSPIELPGDEPANFETSDVVAFLRRHGRPAFADWVKHLQSSLQSERAWTSTLSSRLQELLPPPVFHEPYNPRPPAEASD